MTDVPEVLGPYELGERLGAGGMGVVYRAHHRELGRQVALKLLTLDGDARPAGLERFKREARILAALDHPGIVRVLDIGEDQGRPYIAMELIDGPSLAEHLTRERLPLERSLDLMAAIARAVGHVHERGYVHRDLKPQNVLLDSSSRPHVSDFGLGRALDSTSRLTRTRQIVGTLQYIAPELLDEAGRDANGPGTDVFSLGVMLYEMLAGRLPFQGESHIQLFREIAYTDPPAPHELHPSIPEAASAVCLKALCKNPRHRYANGHALADDLERLIQGQPILGRSEPLASRLRRRLRRHPALVGATAVAVLGGTLAAAWVMQNHASEQARRGAEIGRLLAEGRRAESGGDHARAATAYARALWLAPEDGQAVSGRRRAVLDLARRALADKQPAAAAFLLQDFLQAHPQDTEARGLNDRIALALASQPREIEAAVARMKDELAAAGEGGRVVSDGLKARHSHALVSHRAPYMVDLLLPELGSPRAAVREVAARALQHLADPRALPALLQCLPQEPDIAVQTALAEAAAQLAPQDPAVRDAIVVASEARKGVQEAFRAALDALGMAPRASGAEDLDGELRAGALLIGQGKLPEAIEHFSALLERRPDLPGALNNRGIAYRRLGRPDLAVADFSAILTAQPEDVDVLSNRGLAYLNLGRPDLALADLERACRLDPRSAVAHYNRACVHLQTRRWPEALADLQRCLEIDRGYLAAINDCGKVQVELGRYDEALASFSRVIELNPGDPTAYCNRAVIHGRLGKTERMFADYERALRLAPDHRGVYANRAEAHLRLGDARAALADYDRAIELKGDDPVLLQRRAACRAGLGLRDEARADLQQADRLTGGRDPSIRAALERLGPE